MAKSKKPGSGGGTINSIRRLAVRIGRSHVRVQHYLADERWLWATAPPWPASDVPAMVRWIEQTFPKGDGEGTGGGIDPLAEIRDLSPVKRAQLQLVVERAAKLKIEREMLLGGYVKKEDVERGRVERILAVKAELRNARLLPLKLPGKSLPEQERLMEDWARAVCRKFAGQDQDDEGPERQGMPAVMPVD